MQARKVLEPLDRLCVNTIRTLSIDAVQNANSGHPGLPMGAAPMAYVLWTRHLHHDPRWPQWPDRDRFVLSAGHGSMLLYSLLHLTGYDLTLDDLKNFRQWESKTPGHPEFGMTPGVEATTGPLGQGTANAVGMAIAERHLASRFNRPGHEIVGHFTYALVSDGDIQEGISAEAAALAGHLKLGKLITLYDANGVTLDGPAALTMSEDVAARYRAYGWHVQVVEDGDHDLAAIDRALEAARAHTTQPSLIVVHTTLGYGSPNKAGKADAHGAPLGVDEVAASKQQLGWPSLEPFHRPEEALRHLRACVEHGAALSQAWRARWEVYAAGHPDLAQAWRQAQSLSLPDGWDRDIPRWQPGPGPATRVASGKVLNALAGRVGWLMGGDADLSGSTKTSLAGEASFDGQTGAGRNLHFGIREHAMAAICNGMAYHGGVRPYCSTFFVFSDYMRPSIRLAALTRQPAIYVWTHDSVGVGEDGPTHQPVEHLMALRAMPGLRVFRPGDANETAAAWRTILEERDGPAGLVLSRQDLPVLEGTSADGVAKGAYVLAEASEGLPRVLLLATGSELSVAVEARRQLQAEGIACRVVSMPCWELFARQDPAYRDAVLPPSVTARVSVEAGVTLGWERWVGTRGRCVGIDRFGASAPGPAVLRHLGIDPARVVAAAREAMDRGSAR